ncbi:MAG: pyridoxamine 5'-phosphate oxidase [Cyclobacteriaceae bacterium]
MINEALFNLRKEYAQRSLDESDVAPDPFQQFTRWWKEASDASIDEVNAMTLATVTPDGAADARIVLLKAFDEQGYIFFTNYLSRKGTQLDAQPSCCLLFFWKELERQVRILGRAERLSAAESIRYFESRPDGSKIGAWASPQSMVVAGRAWLEQTYLYYRERFQHGAIARPPHWGGYRVVPHQIEFWQGRPNRMHDRIQFTQEPTGNWKIERLAP